MKTEEVLEKLSYLQDEAIRLQRPTLSNLLTELKQHFKLCGTTDAPKVVFVRFSQLYSHKILKDTLARLHYESITKKPDALQGFKIRLKPKKGT